VEAPLIRAAWVVLLTVTGFACGRTGLLGPPQDAGANADSGTDVLGDAQDWATFCALEAKVLCKRRSACGLVDSAFEPVCEQQQAARCQRSLPLVDAGTVLFHVAAATTCLQSIATLTCGQAYDTYDPGGSCAPVAATALYSVLYGYCSSASWGVWEDPGSCFLTPNAKLGQPCDANECVEGYCPFSEGACSACTPFRSLAETCDDNTRLCDPSLTCANSSVCVARAPAGAACEGNSMCAINAVCDGTGHCATLLVVQPVGSWCGFQAGGSAGGTEYGCGTDAFCQEGVCTPTLPKGASCSGTSGNACGAGFCLEGTCQMPPPQSLAVGQACVFDDECAGDAHCAEQTQTCTAWSELGAACGSASDCWTGACVQGTCVAPVGQGADCGTTACAWPLDCRVTIGGSQCQPYVDVGAPCNIASPGNPITCLTGYCMPTDAGSACVAPLSTGQPCDPISVACASGFCDWTLQTCNPSCF
jgi:hypothetical protein